LLDSTGTHICHFANAPSQTWLKRFTFRQQILFYHKITHSYPHEF